MPELPRMVLSLWTLLERHPKRLTAAFATLAAVSGGGAFAVAALGPDPSALPVHQVIETAVPLPLEPQLQALEQVELRLRRSTVTRPADTADSLLQRLGIADPEAAAFLRRDPLVRQVLLGRSGRGVRAEANGRHELLELSARWVANDDEREFQRLVVRRGANGFHAELQHAPLIASQRLASGTIQSSLFAAADAARIPDAVTIQLAEIFASNIDFHRALRKGDRFSVVYEALEADGEPLRAGRVLSAEFVNGDKTFNAIWFQEPGKKGGYYDFDGKSLQHAFLASPLAFSRVTSGFSLRFHPILKQWKAHLGVDYGAPTGTPVRAVGDATVAFAGVQTGYGNVVILRHRNGAETVYAHLSRILVRAGQAVAQGDTLGAVGATGWATGPHLHYEFRVNGKPEDPLKIARAAEATPVSHSARPAFEQVAATMRINLRAAGGYDLAAAQ